MRPIGLTCRPIWRIVVRIGRTRAHATAGVRVHQPGTPNESLPWPEGLPLEHHAHRQKTTQHRSPEQQRLLVFAREIGSASRRCRMGWKMIAAASFGADVRGRRVTSGATVRQVSDRMSDLGVRIDPSGISRIENGTRMPRLDEALALASALGTSLADMLGREGTARVESTHERLVRLSAEVACLASNLADRS